MLHVDLQERDRHSELTFVWVLLDVVEYVVYRSGHQTILEHGACGFHALGFAAEDGVGFAAAGLTVSHDDSVESIEHILNHGPSDLFVGFVLGTVGVENVVEIVVARVVVVPNQGDALVGI